MILKLLAKLFPADKYEVYEISVESFPMWPEWLMDALHPGNFADWWYGDIFILDGETGIVVKKDHNDKD